MELFLSLFKIKETKAWRSVLTFPKSHTKSTLELECVFVSLYFFQGAVLGSRGKKSSLQKVGGTQVNFTAMGISIGLPGNLYIRHEKQGAR
jgi:hypothetical protein